MAVLSVWAVTGHQEHGDGTSSYRTFEIEQFRGELETGEEVPA